MLSKLRTEPAVITGVIVSVALFLGYDLDPDTVLQIVSIVAPLVTGIVTRFFVTPITKTADG